MESGTGGSQPGWLAGALVVGALMLGAVGAAAQESSPAYDRATRGTRWLENGRGLAIKVLVEPSNLGGAEVEIAEITFPPGPAAPAGHRHGSIEIFYIRSGVLDHIVDGEAHRLEPGMVGIVRPGDSVIHRVVGDAPVEALVIWAPGGEVDRLARFFEERPVDVPGG